MFYGNNCGCGEMTTCGNGCGFGFGFNWITELIWLIVILNIIQQLFCNNGLFGSCN